MGWGKRSPGPGNRHRLGKLGLIETHNPWVAFLALVVSFGQERWDRERPAWLFGVCPEESQVRLAVYKGQTSGLAIGQVCSGLFSVQPWEPEARLLEAFQEFFQAVNTVFSDQVTLPSSQRTLHG